MNSELDAQILQDALKAVANAELHCHRSRSGRLTGVSAVTQKAALIVLLAHEGQMICNTALADRIGISRPNVSEVIGALIEQGFVREFRESKDRRRYTVDTAALKARAVSAPLWAPRRYGPRPKLDEIASDGMAELRRVLPSVGLMADEAEVIRGRSNAREVAAKRMRVVVYLRDSLFVSFPKIALLVRGNAGKYATCSELYKRAKRTG